MRDVPPRDECCQTEAEKGVLQLASMGIRNVVSTAGKTISKHQVELITRTGCTPILSYDKDVQEEELKEIAEMFMDGISVYAIIDTQGRYTSISYVVLGQTV